MTSHEKILSQVSEYYGVDVFQKTHRRDISFPRFVAMYLLVVFTDMKLADIGRLWPSSDHSMVIYANKQVRAICRFNPEIRKQIIELESKLE